MSIPKTLVTKREDDTRPEQKRRVSAVSTDQESLPEGPAKKLVRWSNDLPAPPADISAPSTSTSASPNTTVTHDFLRTRDDKMSQREQRKRSSPPPSELTVAELRASMQKMERNIHKAARKELQLLNQSKKLRDLRQKMTERHGKLSKMMQRATRASDPTASVTRGASLPPVFGSEASPAVIDLC